MKKKGGVNVIEGALKKFENSKLGKTILDNIDDDSDDEYDETSVKPKTQRSPEEERLLKNLNDFAEKYKGGRRKTKKLRRKFDNCVKAVRKTVKARKGSTKKQAAYAICTKTILSK